MHIFLCNYWWQRSDIWSQASYRYPISWDAFFDPSDSYFLFVFDSQLYVYFLCQCNSLILTLLLYKKNTNLDTNIKKSSNTYIQNKNHDTYIKCPWTYMHFFRHIFLSNSWWQRSDIWSQASYRYSILWEAFFDPSDSYFLFADFVNFSTHWTYMLHT
jgi:hypothetical protein